ncbi:MAG TPA: EamA family transporter, partial [Longimicrobium sp.]|nr:EamA family transporter [Longimicrobium sp.]
AYLTVFGSLVAFTAYTWLLGVVSPARASTYAYVNPLVAVMLGWALANEALTARVAVSAVVIVAAVALITSVGEAARESMPEGAPAGRGGVPLPEAAGRAPAPRARRSWVRRIRS